MTRSEIASPSPGAAPADELFCQVLEELHHQAYRLMRSQPGDHTLQPTALVNEAYVRLSRAPQVRWNSRSHFLRHAARAMRTILVDHARAKNAKKRTPPQIQLVFNYFQDTRVELLTLEDGIRDLYDKNPQAARVVEMRFFTGASIEETADALQISKRSVNRKWEFARTYLHEILNE